MEFNTSLDFALQQDKNDSLKHFRDKFYFPQHNGKNSIYFTGNSLGLQPKSTAKYIQQELNDWAEFGVEGHFMAKNPWFAYHEMFAEPLSKIVGAKPTEVVAMNALTVNLHLLMLSFYKPTSQRYKILCEAKAFPSDQYALQSQAQLHGFKPEEALIEISPREGEKLIRLEDILFQIEQNADSLALVMMGGVNYFTGQLFDMETITKAAHGVGAKAGFDLAHAAGNVKLELHNWKVDFACWCSYKYLNSGPGGVSGIFVHEKHAQNKDTFRLSGWWGQNKNTRFLMEKEFDPIPTAESWQMSNAPVLSMAAHKASLDIFEEAGIENLIAKSKKLSAYLIYLIQQLNTELNSEKFHLEIISPLKESERGCQVSIVAHGLGKNLFNKLAENGVIADWREPNVIRTAPVPLYNNFEDCWHFYSILKKILNS